MGDHLEHAAHGIARAICLVHHFLHLLFDAGIDAAQQNFLLAAELDQFFPARLAIEPHASDRNDMAQDLDAELPEQSFRDWWREQARQNGALGACRLLAHELWDFLRDSTPERRRRRFGDMEYDWDHRVNTTGGSVGWPERLLGVFLSAYQPTEPQAFSEMMAALPIPFEDYTFVDLGSGKGRTLLMASGYPFRRIIGIEILPGLHRAAKQNIRDYRSPAQRCARIESICADARAFALPEEPLVLFLFNPLPEAGLRQVLKNLAARRSKGGAGSVWIVYHNPLLRDVIREAGAMAEAAFGEHFIIYRQEPDLERKNRAS